MHVGPRALGKQLGQLVKRIVDSISIVLSLKDCFIIAYLWTSHQILKVVVSVLLVYFSGTNHAVASERWVSEGYC